MPHYSVSGSFTCMFSVPCNIEGEVTFTDASSSLQTPTVPGQMFPPCRADNPPLRWDQGVFHICSIWSPSTYTRDMLSWGRFLGETWRSRLSEHPDGSTPLRAACQLTFTDTACSAVFLTLPELSKQWVIQNLNGESDPIQQLSQPQSQGSWREHRVQRHDLVLIAASKPSSSQALDDWPVVTLAFLSLDCKLVRGNIWALMGCWIRTGLNKLIHE